MSGIKLPETQENASVTASLTDAAAPTRKPVKTLREKEAESFHAVLVAVLTAGLEAALAAGDHPKAIDLVNRGFAEGTPELGCALFCRAIEVVGTARTWTVQLAPLGRGRQVSTTPGSPAVSGLA